MGEINIMKINKVTIPNRCNCIWCGGTMKSGSSKISAREEVCSNYSYWCETCGAVVIHIKNNNSKKIKNLSFEVKYEE